MTDNAKRRKALNAIVLEERRERVMNLYVTGMRQREIAKKLGVSPNAIANDIKCIREQWRTSALADFGESVNRELEKIRRLENEYWQAWERSKAKEGEAGDPKFLDGFHKCIDTQLRIIGGYAPTKTESKNDGGGTTVNNQVNAVVVIEDGDWYGRSKAEVGSTGPNDPAIASDDQHPASPAASGADPVESSPL